MSYNQQSEKPTRFVYVRDAKNHPIGCIAVNVRRNKNYAEYGLSMCNPKDTVDEKGRSLKFDRTLAQGLAMGDLDNNPKRTYITTEADMHEATASVLGNIIANGTAPTRAIRFAKRWLNEMWEL
jgi:hypothetical protein